MGLNIWLKTWFMRNCQRVSRMVDFTTNSPQLVNILTDIFMVNYPNFGHSDGCTLNLHFPDESLYRAFSRCILITNVSIHFRMSHFRGCLLFIIKTRLSLRILNPIPFQASILQFPWFFP